MHSDMVASPSLRAGLALVLALTAGCESVFDPGKTITLPITALDAPGAVAAGEGVVVRVTVESGGCRTFQRLEAQRAPGRVTLTARGRDSSGPSVNCPADIRTDIRDYGIDPPLADPFTVAAHQPDGSEMTRVIRVQ